MSAQRHTSGVTLIAASAAAYSVADFAHEGLGHGGACLLLGGRLLVVSTTYADCTISSRLIDAAGPVAGIAVALLAWLWLRFAPPRAFAARAFLSCLFAFAIFWNVGYLVKSGLLDAGDWASVIRGMQPFVLWHVVLVTAGIASYAAAMRLLAVVLRTRLAGSGERTPQSFGFGAWAAAVLLSVLAACFDPRGPSTILTDALPSSLASAGLAYVGWVMGRRDPALLFAEPGSLPWQIGGAALAALFVAVLGPGLRL